MSPFVLGVLAVLVYTGLISVADGITKLISSSYAPAQLFAVSGLLIAALCAGLGQVRERRDRSGPFYAIRCRRAMAIRSVSTVFACISYFYAFRFLTLAEVFVFVSLSPIVAALMSGLILKEQVRPTVWVAIVMGAIGLFIMRPTGQVSGLYGVLFALAGVGFGTLSLVMARYISRYEDNVLAQVFYPNLTLGLVMLCALPFVWEPMSGSDWRWVLVYAVVLFGARWLLVYALQHLPAYTVTPLLHMQFVWVALIGVFYFAEYPPVASYFGMIVVAASGGYLVWDQARRPAKVYTGLRSSA